LFFDAVLGEPPAMRNWIVKYDYTECVCPESQDLYPSIDNRTRVIPRSFEVSTFIDRDYYVQVICDDDEKVLAFSVTTRSRRFRPVYEVHQQPGPIERWRRLRLFGKSYRPLVRLKLGHTTFADLDPLDLEQFAGPRFLISMGAHNHAYSEIAYEGNDQSFVWTASDAARQGRFGNGFAVTQEIHGNQWPDPQKAEITPDWVDMVETQRFRRETVVTTYTVIHPSLSLINYPLERFGPHETDVRLIPSNRSGFSGGFYPM
jgi:hypothetical protein